MENRTTTQSGNSAGIAPQEGRPAARTSPRRRGFAIAAAAILIIAALAGWRWYIHSQSHISTDDAQVEPQIYAVSSRVAGHVLSVYVDENDPVVRGQLLVEVDPADYRVAVTQARAALEQGQRAATAAASEVKVTQQTGGGGIAEAEAAVAGARSQELMSRQELASARDEIASAEAAENAAEADVAMAKEEVAASRAAVVSAEAVAEQARKDAARIATLEAEGAVSAQQLDAAQAQSATADAAVDAASARLGAAEAAALQARAKLRQATLAVAQAHDAAAAAQAGLSQAGSGVRQAEARLRSSLSSPEQVRVRELQAASARAQAAVAAAALKQAELDLSYTRITAPVAGLVGAKNVRRGQYVMPGTPLIGVVSQDRTYVLANYKETQLDRIRVGQRATFTVDAYPGLEFSGRVVSMSPGTGSVFSLLPPENASGNFTKVVQRVPVRILVDTKASPHRPLRVGMSVVVTVYVK